MSPATVGRVALAMFRETVRDRVLYALVAFAILVIGASLLISQLTAGQDVKIIKDLGLAAMSMIGAFIAVFIGIGLVSKEGEKRSIYRRVAKPVRRSELVAGKYAGLVLTLAINLAIMTAVWYGVLSYFAWTAEDVVKKSWEAPALDPRMLLAVYLIFLQLMLVTAIALFFSTFSSPMLAALFTFGLFVAGHFNADLRNFEGVVASPIAGALARALYYLLPNMALFDVKSAVVHARPVTSGYVAGATLYAGLYIGALVLTSVAIFSRRDFK